jgi:tetratricopeptide (TPR) repeat protein
MRYTVLTLSIVILASIGAAFTIAQVTSARHELKREEGVGLVMPTIVVKIVALEYKGLLSDAIFSKTMTYYGGKLIKKEPLTEDEWTWIYRNMDLSTDLDPYFLDPYYFGAMNLAWEANRIDEANMLLVKAFHYRDWDWTIPFYLGFNHFYFLQDNIKASEYLMEASKKPGAISVLATLAARLSYQERKTENAIMFLQEILKKTEDENLKRQYEIRLHALKATLQLEQAVAVYRNRFHKTPAGIDELIRQGIVREPPRDPYGGSFYLDSQGSVKTTSDFMVKSRQ